MKIKGLKLLSVLFTSMLLTSCSGLYDDGYSIENIQVSKNNGVTTCVITYTDEDVSPITFTINDGVAGQDGVSIKTITAKVNEDKSTTITITFSDESVSPMTFTIPAGQKGDNGQDGRSVTGVNVTSDDENGYTIVTFTYSDNTTSEEIKIPHGKDGTSINDISSVANDDGTTTITITITTTTAAAGRAIRGRFCPCVSPRQALFPR